MTTTPKEVRTLEDRVLVVNVDTQIGLAVARSLGRKGITVYGAGTHKNSIGFYSKYVKDHLILPYFTWNKNEQEYIDALIEFIWKRGINHVMAIAEHVHLLLNEHREEIEKHAKLVFPPSQLMDKVFNKKATLETARTLGIPVPETLYVDWEEESPDLTRAKEFRFPLVIKPINRVLMQRKGTDKDFKIRYLNSYEELLEQTERLRGFPFMVQGYCKGKGLTLCALRFDSDLPALFQYKVLHAYPPLGGYSIYRESAPINALARDYSFRLLEKLEWEGVCEVEFIQEGPKDLTLMEINGRFWGALPLAVKSGVDFPYLTFQALGKSNKIRNDHYPIGVRCCLLGGELNWLMAMLKSDRGLGEKARAIKEFIGSFSPWVKHDVQTLDDIKPGIMDLWLLFRSALRKLKP